MDNPKFQTLKGFRDFLPEEARIREYALRKIRDTFRLFGFDPLETPALEYQDVLLGKYGEEADKLVYTFQDKGGRNLALRYDQTVPTAKVISLYKDKINQPFRRYQTQPVWRADKPQKGRFREITMCDIDIYQTTSPVADAEIMAASYACLKNLGIEKFKILINDREILFNIMEQASIPQEMHLSTIQSLDKLDKKPQHEIIDELSKKGLSDDQVNNLFDELDKVQPSVNLLEIIKLSESLGIKKEDVEFKPHLARGLDYYTGTIYEIVVDGYTGGSIAGGGRYDNLIEKLSGINVPAVGLALGLDRIIEVLEQFELIPQEITTNTVLVTIFKKQFAQISAITANYLRKNAISTELYPNDSEKLNKQLKYANKKEFEFAVIIGPDEVKKDEVVLKNLNTGEQSSVNLKDLIQEIKKQISKIHKIPLA